MIEITSSYTSTPKKVRVDEEDFMCITAPAYKKSWLVTRLFMSESEGDYKQGEDNSYLSVDHAKTPIVHCHKSHLKVFVFVDKVDGEWAPHWNYKQGVLVFPIKHGTMLNRLAMEAIGKAIVDVVPDYVETEIWHTQEQMWEQFDKFTDYLVEQGVCSPGNLDKRKSDILIKVAEVVKKEEDRLSDHLSPKDTTLVPKSNVDMDLINKMCAVHSVYRNFLKSLAEVMPAYDIKLLEGQSKYALAPFSQKGMFTPKALKEAGMSWTPVAEMDKKVVSNTMGLSSMPFDYMWAIQPSARMDGPGADTLINPKRDVIHSHIFTPFRNNARAASVLTGMLMFGCGFSKSMRLKSGSDSKMICVIRAIITEAIKQIPDEDALLTHLQDERYPDSSTIPLAALADSMVTWCRAMAIGYSTYHAQLSEIVVDLNARVPDGQKNKWDANVLGDFGNQLLVSKEMEPHEGPLIFADLVEFTDSTLRPGKKCVRIVFKPTIIAYDQRVYSMGRYAMEINFIKTRDMAEPFLTADFISEECHKERRLVRMVPCPRNPNSGELTNNQMHSHVSARGWNGDGRPSATMCLGAFESRYYKNSGYNNTGGGTNLPIQADHVFDGAPESVKIKSINPAGLANAMYMLLTSCYKHTDGHPQLSMTNWANARIR
jgi:hypothetical protein